MSPTPDSLFGSLADIAAKHGVPEKGLMAVYLNVSTFATQEPLAFLGLCMCLDNKRVAPDSPAYAAIERWSLGMLLGEGQFNMSSVVEDVMRYVEGEFMRATKG